MVGEHSCRLIPQGTPGEEFVFQFQKNRSQQNIARTLRSNNSSLRESNRAIPQAPYSLTDQKQSHLFKIENGLVVVNMFHFHNWSKES